MTNLDFPPHVIRQILKKLLAIEWMEKQQAKGTQSQEIKGIYD